MITSTISSQGQIAIPKRLRDLLDIQPGSKVALIPHPYSITLVPHKRDWTKKARGILKREITKAGGVKKSHALFEKEWHETYG